VNNETTGVIVGVDPGQQNDPTAICVIRWRNDERRATEEDRARECAMNVRRGVLAPLRTEIGRVIAFERHYSVVALDRLPLGTPYPGVTDRIRHLMLSPPLINEKTRLAVDSTGIGRAVVDDMRGHGLSPIPVNITGGTSESVGNNGYRNVPKKDLVAAIAVMLQSRRLTIPAELVHAERLAEELANFRVKFSATGHESFGAWREGQHDDLVLALGVALWLGERDGRRRQPLDPADWISSSG
jgi:hypothetical protein